MNCSLGQIILAASEGEDVIWIQILVLVILASFLVIGTLIKTRANKLKGQRQDYPEGAGNSQTQTCLRIKHQKELKDKSAGILLKTAQARADIEEATFGFDVGEIVRRGRIRNDSANERDLTSGMELLKADFLVRTVENTEGDGNNNAMMRKLSFYELLRRGQLDAVASDALKVYAMNEGNLYGKDIQCEAMKELAERTIHRPV